MDFGARNHTCTYSSKEAKKVSRNEGSKGSVVCVCIYIYIYIYIYIEKGLQPWLYKISSRKQLASKAWILVREIVHVRIRLRKRRKSAEMRCLSGAWCTGENLQLQL